MAGDTRKTIYTIIYMATCTWQLSPNVVDSTLVQLFVVYRHGDRAPVSLYKTDPNPVSSWPDGLGELTNLGKQEHYSLGKYIRNRYQDFLTNDTKEMEARSSNVNRCLESAESNLASLYLPLGRQIWNPNLDWLPIPVHTRPEVEDPMLTIQAPCPEYEKELQRIIQSETHQAFLRKHKHTLDYLTNYTGQKVQTVKTASYIYDTLLTEKIHKLIIPDWVDAIWEDGKEISDYSFFYLASTTLARRLSGGVLLKDIISKMEKKVQKPQEDQPKAYMYSTHDTVISNLMSAIGVFNGKAPPYCSTFFLELHENGPHNHTARLFYRNSTIFDKETPQDEPMPLDVPGCQQNCPLGHFILLTQDSVPLDWKEECGMILPTKPFSPTAVAIISSMGVILLMLLLGTTVMLWLRCQKEKSEIRYQRIINSSTET